jgi:hypothetical protein
VADSPDVDRFGSQISIKPINTLRIGFQNIGGFSTKQNTLKNDVLLSGLNCVILIFLVWRRQTLIGVLLQNMRNFTSEPDNGGNHRILVTAIIAQIFQSKSISMVEQHYLVLINQLIEFIAKG